MIKEAKIFLILTVMSLPTYASEIYFTQKQMDRFSCKVARSIQESYPNKSLRDFRVEILNLLRAEIKPWVDAYPIPAGIAMPKPIEKITGLPGLPMARSEYYLQNAFILYGNPERELREPTENYFASFIHLARSRHISYLNGKEKKFNLREEENLIEQIEDHLPHVADYAFPHLDEKGLPIKENRIGKKAKNSFMLAVGNPNHKKYDEFVYESQKYNHFSSPLFLWLLKQKDFSVSPEELFDKALDIYGDPFVALGVIPWIFSGDALTVNRGNSSVVSYKIKRFVKGDDVSGLQYHFWGYLTQGFIGNKIRVGFLSYLYEDLYQNDIEDRTVDILALQTSDKIRSIFNNSGKCQ